MLTRPAAPSGSSRGVIAESLAIPAQAARLLVRHLPQLITLVCLGVAGCQAVTWLAVWVSSFSSLAAMLIMPLAPACVMASLVFCLWQLQPSLPFFSRAPLQANSTDSEDIISGGTGIYSKGKRSQPGLSVAALLIPFLTAYTAHGMLSDDLATFRRGATTDEYFNKGFSSDTSRSFIDETQVLIGLVVVTIILRKALGRVVAKKEPNTTLNMFAAYLEVLWTATGSAFIAKQVQNWAFSRRSIAPAFQSIRDASSEFSTDSSGFFTEVAAWFSAHAPALYQFITVPIAWLTLTVIVFGAATAIDSPPSTGGTHEESDTSYRRQAMHPVLEPLKSTWNGLRVLTRSGLFPVVLFCLVFTLANFVEIGAIMAGRAIIGPQEVLAAEVAALYILTAAKAAYLIVVVCLIASATDYFAQRSAYFTVEEFGAAPAKESEPLEESASSSSTKGIDAGSSSVT